MRAVQHRSWIWAAVVLVLMQFGCVSVPHMQLDGYLADFKTAKSTADDVLLGARLAAREIAESPYKTGPQAAKEKERKDREAALDARIRALEVIDQFNDILVQLASGVKPKQIESNVLSLQQGLNSFGFGGLASLASGPALGLVTQGLAVVENWSQKKKFKKAALAAYGPVTGIIEILKQDADNIFKIREQLLLLPAEDDLERMDSLRFDRFQPLIDEYQASDELTKQLDAFNTAQNALRREKKKPAAMHQSNTKAVTPEALAVMQGIIADMTASVAEYNRRLDEVAAYEALIEEYKNMLTATSTSFGQLNRAVVQGHSGAAVEFLGQALSLREAYLRYQEAKT